MSTDAVEAAEFISKIRLNVNGTHTNVLKKIKLVHRLDNIVSRVVKTLRLPYSNFCILNFA